MTAILLVFSAHSSCISLILSRAVKTMFMLMVIFIGQHYAKQLGEAINRSQSLFLSSCCVCVCVCVCVCASDPPQCNSNYFLSSQGVSLSSSPPHLSLALPSFLSAVYLVNLIRSLENPGDSLKHTHTHTYKYKQ